MLDEAETSRLSATAPDGLADSMGKVVCPGGEIPLDPPVSAWHPHSNSTTHPSTNAAELCMLARISSLTIDQPDQDFLDADRHLTVCVDSFP
jgi:hypothetical protein